MLFESFDLPDTGDLAPTFREAAKQGVNERSDLGDQLPLDWVCRLYASFPDWRDRVDDAFAELLTAEDPLPKRVLDQVTKLPARSFLPRLYGVITGRCAELAARLDTTRTDGRSLLGSIVNAAATMQKAVQPSRALAHELAAMTRPEDGWPETLLLALPGDVDGLLPRLTPTLKQLDDAQLEGFARGMIADGSPWTDRVLEEIGRGPHDLRDRVATVVKAFTNESSAMSSMSFPDDPELQALMDAAAKKPNPWPQYAARLGVSV